jgi:hypothetical protein
MKDGVMIPLFLIAALAETPPADADAASTPAEKNCVARLATRAGGEISLFTVKHRRQAGRETVLSGTMNVLRRPIVRPGEMTPTHIVAAPYSFECRWNGHRVSQARLSPLSQ